MADNEIRLSNCARSANQITKFIGKFSSTKELAPIVEALERICLVNSTALLERYFNLEELLRLGDEEILGKT